MGKNWPKIVFFQVFEKKFGIKFRCEKIYWNNFKILNKKYFWNAKVEIKITILFKCLQKNFWSNSAVKNKIVSNLRLELFFLSISKFWRFIFNGLHCLKNGKITNERSAYFVSAAVYVAILKPMTWGEIGLEAKITKKLLT